MREVGLGHTTLDDQQDDWRRAVRLGSELGFRRHGGERAGRARAREARWREGRASAGKGGAVACVAGARSSAAG